jgi:hypothetical protein
MGFLCCGHGIVRRATLIYESINAETMYIYNGDSPYFRHVFILKTIG